MWVLYQSGLGCMVRAHQKEYAMDATTEHKPFARNGKGNKNHPNKHLETPHPETGRKGVKRKRG